jgi:hypothetical protein
MKALESRTLQSTFFMAIISMVVAGLLELVPELASYDTELFEILEIVLWAVAIRFGVAGIVSEAVKAYKG